jgi:arylsulfatase A-like enzyme
MAGPGIKPGHIPDTVSLTGLTPTVLDLAGFIPPSAPEIDGESIAPLALGRRAPNPDGGVAFAAMIKDRSNPGGLTAVVSGRWKLIDNGTSLELYDTRSDPDEHSNLITTHPPVLDQLRLLLRARQEAAKTSPFR